MVLRLIACALALGLSLGCPFVDELNKSSAEMDKYSPTARKQAKEKEEAAKNTEVAKGAAGKGTDLAASAKEAASKWWGNAKSLAPDEASKDVVRCVTPSGEQFMSKKDCQMRAGLAKPL